MGIMDGYQEEQEREQRERDGWRGDYDGTACIKCSRVRVVKSENGKRTCEKCGWDQDADEMSAIPRDMIG